MKNLRQKTRIKSLLGFLPGILLLLLVLFQVNCRSVSTLPQLNTEDLRIRPLSKHTYIHVSYLHTEQWGRVACNGMIVANKGEAIIFDTPATDSVSTMLINWVEQQLKCRVKAVIPTHFHIDCLGGLQAFHQRGIASYANKRTIELAKTEGSILPQNSFDGQLEFRVGNITVQCTHPGEGHTRDNIIAYVPTDQVIFGGCLVKSLKAGKGNLADANVTAWPQSIKNIKTQYSEIKSVIPGHGKAGGVELLDYTIQMFEKTKK